MILSLSQDAEYQTRGAERVIDNGGVQGWFAAEYDSFSGVGRSTLYSTAFAYTPSDIALHAHQIVPYLDRSPVFRFGTGSNYNTNRGTVFEINNVITVPGYVNGSSRASIQDLAVAHLAGQLNNFTAPVFATSRPVAGETLTFAGYGVLGTPDTGLIGQDGAIRYGVTRATGSQDPLGASPALYIETQTNVFGEFPFGNAATRGDSGAILTNSLNEIVASYTHSSLNPLTGVAAGLDYTRQDALAFLRDNQSYVTSVPEPSSILMLAACAVSAGFVRCRRRFIGDRRTQIQDDVITSKLPHRTRSEFAQVVARKVGLGTAMMGAATRSWGQYFQEKGREIGMGAAMAASAVGLSGFGERRADAGILLTFDAVETSKIPGAAATTDNGGPLVGVEALFADGSRRVASGIGYNTLTGEGRAYTSGHFRYNLDAPGAKYSVITGPDLNNPTGRYEVASFQTAPGFSGDGSLGTAMDLELWYLKAPITGAGMITIPIDPLTAGTTINSAGYGTTGVWNNQYLGQDLFARGFTSRVETSGTLLGANPDLYTNTRLNVNDPTSGRPASGDSGSPLFTLNNNVFEIRGMYTHGDNPIFGQRGMFLDFSSEQFQSFHNTYGISAVPEPSSMALTCVAAAFSVLLGRFRSTGIVSWAVSILFTGRWRKQVAGLKIVYRSEMTTVLLSVVLGIAGIPTIEGRHADAGFMLVGSDPDSFYQTGLAQTVPNGGNTVYMKYSYTYQGNQITGVASGTGYNDANGVGRVIGNSHVDYLRSVLGATLTVGTGPDVATNPGAQYSVVKADTFATYTGPDLWRTTPDLTVFTLDRPIEGAGNLVFAKTRPVAGEFATWAGYDVQKFSDGSQYKPEGTITGGKVEVFNIHDSRFSSEHYGNTIFLGGIQGELGPLNGASQASLRNSANEVFGIWAAGSGYGDGWYVALNEGTAAHSFIINVTSVPEPSSFTLMVLGTIACGALATVRSSRKKSSNIEDGTPVGPWKLRCANFDVHGQQWHARENAIGRFSFSQFL